LRATEAADGGADRREAGKATLPVGTVAFEAKTTVKGELGT
jgi:hypothetical protein